MKNVSVKKMNGKGKNAFRAVLIVVALIFATCFALVLVACVPTEVQIEEVTSESEVNRLVSANFSEEEAVREEMTKQYGALSDFEYNNGKATANVEKDGKSYAVSAEIDLGASDFEVTKYTNAERSGNNLTYTLDGQDVSENVSDKIVVEENGVIYVIDPSEALNTISIAVSDAILTENVDPENPGGEDKPAPDEPENPGGEDKPDPDEPENPGGEENPDPEKPEEPGGEGGTVEIKYEEYQNFDEFVLDLEGENLDAFKTAVSEKLRSEFSAQNFLTIFGRNSNLDNTSTYQIGFNFDDAGNIASLEYVGLRNDTKIATATISFVEPIKIEDTAKVTYLGDVEKIIENGELVGIKYNEQDAHTNVVEKELRLNENQILIEESGEAYKLIDFSTIVSQMNQENFAKVKGGFSHTGGGQLTEEKQQYFDLCMPLAVEAGLIDANATLGFVSVQGSSSTNSKWGTTFNIVIRFVDLNTNKYYYSNFVFDDNRTSYTSTIDAINDAIESGQFGCDIIQPSQIISGDQIFEFSEAMEGIVKYTTPDKNQK